MKVYLVADIGDPNRTWETVIVFSTLEMAEQAAAERNGNPSRDPDLEEWAVSEDEVLEALPV